MDKFASEDALQSATLTELDHMPAAVLNARPHQLHQHLPGPTLFSLKGTRSDPLFITVLLHGNEHTGWQAVQQLLSRYQQTTLPRSILLFVGNIEAARANLRTLSNQQDFNRSWPVTRAGITKPPATAEARIMHQVTSIVRAAQPFASVDIHNNTGLNPPYACLNRLDAPFLHLASMFSKTVMYFERPEGVQSAALAELCPAVTLECGPVGKTAIVEETAAYLDRLLTMPALPTHPVEESKLRLLRTHAIIRLPVDATFSFDGSDADFLFPETLDDLNFKDLTPPQPFGRLGGSKTHRLEIYPAIEGRVADQYFDYSDDDISLTQPAIPAMLTRDANAIRSDCLGYLMHPIDLNGTRRQKE